VLFSFIVLLLIVGAALAVGDRIAASYAERRISERVAQQVTQQKATSEQPRVTIEGIPFLTQVARGDYQEIRIALADFSGPVGEGRTIKMKELDATASDVRAPLSTIRSGNGEVTAGSVTGTGLIDYAQIVQLAGRPGVKLAEQNGKLVGSAPVQALGQTFQISATADLNVQGDLVQVRFSDVKAEGLPNNALVRGLVNTYVQRLAFNLRIPALPLNLQLKSVQPLADGLRITAGASHVSLNSAGL